MEEFFPFCGIAISAIWSGVEVGQGVDRWLLANQSHPTHNDLVLAFVLADLFSDAVGKENRLWSPKQSINRWMERSVTMAARCRFKLALLASLGVWAVLMFASIDLQAQSTATNSAATASTPAPAWTTAEQKKLATLMDTYAKEQPVNSVVTAALGITTGDTVLRARSLTYTVGPLLHGYVPLPNGGLLIVLHNDNAKVIWFYRLEANLKLVAAISRETSQLPVVIPPAEAERNVAVELKFWSAVADQH